MLGHASRRTLRIASLMAITAAATSTTTDGNGQASAVYTAGNTVGTSTIEAEVAGPQGTLLVDFNISVIASASSD